ncbi:MAG: HypC/HybG/HupF family hydrogenase formation chaperone [Candidatus Omnitrophica bacterium]|nr:HypC/HybG/HupF family hydrogenase formation chaperone [Candidatus Omnitrophota bacterium]
MKIVRIEGDDAIVSAGGLKRKANMSLLKDARIGEYVLIHAGFAIERVKAKEAKATLRVIRDIDEIRR